MSDLARAARDLPGSLRHVDPQLLLAIRDPRHDLALGDLCLRVLCLGAPVVERHGELQAHLPGAEVAREHVAQRVVESAFLDLDDVGRAEATAADDEVTAWIALSDVSIEAGCMRFLPGSHKGGLVAHNDTFADDNLLSRGQEIADVDEDRAMFGPLRPGEMSLHHGRCFHASGPNRSTDRRIGLAIRYVTPAVRDHAPGRDWAMPVRGEAPSGGWDCIAGPRGLFHPADLALYERILAGQSQTLVAGAEGKVGMMLNSHRNDLEAVLQSLPALKTPTVSQLSDPDWVAVNTILDESVVRSIVPQLRNCGARGIVEYPISKIIE